MISKKYIAGLVSQVVSVLVPFIITFISVRELDSINSGYWLLFLSASAFLPLLDFGVSPSIIRNISYVMSGANRLVKTGCEDIGTNGGINFNLLGQLVFDIKKLYKKIGCYGGFTILFFGGIYFYKIADENHLKDTLIAWLCFSAGLFFSLYYLYCNPLLIGFEKIIEANVANIISKLVWLFFTVFFIIFDKSNLLIKLSLSFTLSVFAYRFSLMFFLIKIDAYKKVANLKSDESVLEIILHNAVKLGVVGLGSFLISRVSVFITGVYFPISIAGEYALSLQVVFAIMAIAQVALAIRIPKISRLRAEKNISSLKEEVKVAFLSAGGMFLIGMIFFISFNQSFINLIHSNTKFLNSGLLFFITLIYFLELMHSVSATIITTGNNVPFVVPAILSGFAVLLLTFAVLEFTKLDVLGVLLVQGLVQLSYNNWKWPLVLYRELKEIENR